MDSEQFDLVFSGDLIRGADLQQSKLNLARLFKIPENKVDALFSGNPIVLKKGLDFATANKYRVAIKKAGCRVDLIEKVAEQGPGSSASAPGVSAPKMPEKSSAVPDASGAAPNVPARQATAQASPHFDKQEPSAKPQGENALPLPEVHEDVSAASPSAEKAAFDLAPAGADVLTPEERNEFTPLDIDTSELVLRELGADLLDASERTAEPVHPVSELHADLAPAGSDLLTESEKSSIESLELDLSALSLSEPGVDLGEIKEDKPVQIPDVSHLTIE